jgi:hypothetical protein
MAADLPRYEITAGDVTTEAVVIEVDGKTIVQPIVPVVVPSGESFTITGSYVVDLDGE